MKGSAFLRTHASKHGITNASRKLTAAVITELTQHYVEAHGVDMESHDSGHGGGVGGGGGDRAKEDPESSAASELCPIGVAQILQSMKQARPAHQMQVQPPPQQLPPPPPARPQPAHNVPAPAPVVPCLPQYPVPKQFINGQQQVQQQAQQVQHQAQQVQQQVHQQQQHLHLLQQGQQQHHHHHHQGAVTIKRIPTQSTSIATKLHESQVLPEVTVSPVMVAASSSTSPTSALGGGGCAAPILAKTRVELNACGTSLLRPEAAAHKVHNASRKPKDKVVEELWQHYARCHQHDLRHVG